MQLQNYLLRFDSEEASETKSSAKSIQLILLIPIATHSSFRLYLSIQFMLIIKVEVTEHNLAEDWHPHETNLIDCYLQKRKFQVDSRAA